jgi:hypothetical protein
MKLHQGVAWYETPKLIIYKLNQDMHCTNKKKKSRHARFM